MSQTPPPVPPQVPQQPIEILNQEPFVAHQPQKRPPLPRTYMVWNLVLCLACVVTGIIGLVFGSQVTQRYEAGDYEGAERASSNAKLMILASVVLGLINIPFLMLYYALK